MGFQPEDYPQLFQVVRSLNERRIQASHLVDGSRNGGPSFGTGFAPDSLELWNPSLGLSG